MRTHRRHRTVPRHTRLLRCENKQKASPLSGHKGAQKKAEPQRAKHSIKTTYVYHPVKTSKNRPPYLAIKFVCLLQHANVSQGRICSDKFTCCHTETEIADQTFYLTQSQYTDTRPTSPSADPITPGAWQGSHWSANFLVTGMTRPRKNPCTNVI